MNAKQVWQAVLGDLQLRLSRSDYETWLQGTSIVAFEDGLVVIGTPNSFAKQWLERRAGDLIRRTLSNVLGYTVQVRVVVMGNGANGALGLSSRKRTRSGGSASPAQAEGGPKQLSLPTPLPGGLNPRYTFSTYVVGSSNRMAHAAAMAVAENPAHAYNPLFIYGGVGLGKTHLLHAVGHYAREQNPNLQLLYVSSETFTNELIQSIRHQETEQFRQRYRHNDILLIDDIQFIAGKESTQEEFFHTFNSLHAAYKQVVITSDRPPKAILTLEERLRSRFEGGLIVDIQPPDWEIRLAILRARAEEQGRVLPDAVVEFLAQRVQSNIRELVGSLNRVVAYAELNGLPLTADLAHEAMDDIFLDGHRRDLSILQILEAVAQFYNLSLEDLRGKSRSKSVTGPRQVAMHLIREETDTSLAEIGNELGGRDHTTVLYGCDKISREIEVDARLRREILSLREKLHNGV
ncbi:MAG: chromosomal replication initiator protein DnaA [Chloroflexia bacterium]|nr:chromosomal replication initiator protein DnaA [Chloroflexia bacterium]